MNITKKTIEAAMVLPNQGWYALASNLNLSQTEAKALAGFLKLRKVYASDELSDAEKLDAVGVKEEVEDIYDVQPKVLSARRENGTVMSLNEYCEKHGLPRGDVKSYKLVAHTGIPYYNILFHERIEETEFLTDEFLSKIVEKHIKPVNVLYTPDPLDGVFQRAVYTDVHIAMEPDKDGIAPFGGVWNKEEQEKRIRTLAEVILAENRGETTLFIDELGDFVDGQDNMTVRKDHPLTQNMNNEDTFDQAVHLKVLLCDMLVASGNYNKIYFHNCCNDNHAGSMAWYINQAVKGILEIKYEGLVFVENIKHFIWHYVAGDHCFILSHGKDKQFMKNGMPAKMNADAERKLTDYMHTHGLLGYYTEFSKGDSHQLILDYSSSDRFDYCSYASFAPSSEWIQTNYKQGASSFVVFSFKTGVRGKREFKHFF